VAGSGPAKVRRVALRLNANPAERLARDFQCRKAAIMNPVPGKRALVPATIATKLPPAKSFRSAPKGFAMIRIPKIEKPSAWLIRLSPFQGLSLGQHLRHSGFRLWCLSEPEAEIGGGIHSVWSLFVRRLWDLQLAMLYKSICGARVSALTKKMKNSRLFRYYSPWKWGLDDSKR